MSDIASDSLSQQQQQQQQQPEASSELQRQTDGSADVGSADSRESPRTQGLTPRALPQHVDPATSLQALTMAA